MRSAAAVLKAPLDQSVCADHTGNPLYADRTGWSRDDLPDHQAHLDSILGVFQWSLCHLDAGRLLSALRSAAPETTGFSLVVVGMNSMLMYMLGQLFNGWTNEKIVRIHLAGLLEVILGPDALNPDSWGRLIQPSVVFLIYWLFALWLYRQKIFLRV